MVMRLDLPAVPFLLARMEGARIVKAMLVDEQRSMEMLLSAYQIKKWIPRFQPAWTELNPPIRRHKINWNHRAVIQYPAEFFLQSVAGRVGGRRRTTKQTEAAVHHAQDLNRQQWTDSPEERIRIGYQRRRLRSSPNLPSDIEVEVRGSLACVFSTNRELLEIYELSSEGIVRRIRSQVRRDEAFRKFNP